MPQLLSWQGRGLDQVARLVYPVFRVRDAAARGPADSRDSRGDLHDGQWYWDYVASANSMGFHNPELAMRSLAKAIDLAAKAKEDLAP